MSSPRSRQLFKSTAVGFLECREADNIELKDGPIHPRVDPAGTEQRAQRIVEERTWLGEM